MAAIIIKWPVMTTDNPHMHTGFAGRQLFVNAPLHPKTHTDVCVWDKTTNPIEIQAIVLVHARA